MHRARLSAVLAAVLACAFLGSLDARDIHVNHERGDDESTGKRPLRTLAKAIGIAQPGDTIHLAKTKTPYRDSASFFNKSGAPGRPIILDGHGATLCGSDAIVPEQWEEVSPGLYRCATLIKAPPSIAMRWYFVFGGTMSHMGRTSKGTKAPLKKPEELQPGEWTFVKDDNAFYIKIKPKKKLADYSIEAPMRANGVALHGDCNHIIIRNMTATHVWNDGYNIHGKTREVLFENITAIDCGDDGISAHGDCQIRVDGFVSMGNSTGMCHIDNSSSVTDRAFVRGCLARDFTMIGSNTHVLTNSIIYADSERNIDVTGGKTPEEICTVRMENVAVINRRKQPKPITIGRHAVFEAKRLTAYGLSFNVSGVAAKLFDSVIGGDPVPDIVLKSTAKWTADKNVYGLNEFRIDDKNYSPKEFDAYRRATRQDKDSKWTRVEFKQPVTGEIKAPKLPKGVGADLAELPGDPEEQTKGKRKKGRERRKKERR